MKHPVFPIRHAKPAECDHGTPAVVSDEVVTLTIDGRGHACPRAPR
jgi:hypothetical protein